MVVTLTFVDGVTDTVETDFSEMFKDFNTDKLHPMRLTGCLLYTSGYMYGAFRYRFFARKVVPWKAFSGE